MLMNFPLGQFMGGVTTASLRVISQPESGEASLLSSSPLRFESVETPSFDDGGWEGALVPVWYSPPGTPPACLALSFEAPKGVGDVARPVACGGSTSVCLDGLLVSLSRGRSWAALFCLSESEPQA